MINRKIIPALDVQDQKSLDFLINELSNEAKLLKVGMELFYTFGHEIVAKLKEKDFEIFLDLKLHDIPNTVGKSCKTLSRLGIDMLNVHAAGGVEMMKAAADGFKSGNEKGILLGVTQLTSTSQTVMNNELLIPGKTLDVVLKYAENAKKAGLDGVVCSAHEVRAIKKNIGEDFCCVTPGIRPKGSSSHDQKRVMTPSEALEAGSDYLVIGRAICQATSPKEAFQLILKEIS